MLRLEQVNGKNVWDILKLTVEEDQKNYVANNDISIFEPIRLSPLMGTHSRSAFMRMKHLSAF